MQCPYCLEEIHPQARLCKHCKSPLQGPGPGAGAGPGAGGAGLGGAMQLSDNEKKTLSYFLPVNTSLWALIAGYAGLFGLLVVPAPIALLAGLIAIWDLKANPKSDGWGRAWFAIIVGLLGSGLLLIMLLGSMMR